MRKHKVHSIAIALSLCALIFLQSASGLTSNATITSFGQMQYTSTVHKAVTAYGLSFSSTDISFVVNHFDLLNTDFDGTRNDFYIPYLPAMQQIKTASPDTTIIGYKNFIGLYTYNDDWSTANSHEDWFIHDANGNRIRNTGWGWYLMNISSTGWRTHFVSYINSKMNNNAYDGVFADDVRNTIASDEFDRTIPSAAIANWHNDIKGMIQYVKSNMLAGKMLIINTDNWSNMDYLNLADGMMIEGYGHASWEDISSPGTRSTNTILKQVNMLSTGTAAGKLVWGASGSLIPNPADTQKINAMSKYCYGIFLLGANGAKAYWGWNDWYSNENSQGYQSISESNLGSPTGAYYTNQNVYMRNYTAGKVVVNLSANTYTVNFGATYRLINGTTISSETMKPYSAELLLTS